MFGPHNSQQQYLSSVYSDPSIRIIHSYHWREFGAAECKRRNMQVLTGAVRTHCEDCWPSLFLPPLHSASKLVRDSSSAVLARSYTSARNNGGEDVPA